MNMPLMESRQAAPIASSAETAASAAIARVKAVVSARYEVALRQRRNWDQVRQDINKECRRPAFANDKSAYYRKPVGTKGVTGLGIRFVEMALPIMGNVDVSSELIYDDERKEIHRVSVVDLERNFPNSMEVIVTKTVERSEPEDDGSYFRVRTNSYNKLVYTVSATDDDLLNKRGALISKAKRGLGLALIPADIKAEAEWIIRKVRDDEAAKDPDATRRTILDAFMDLNVRASDLEKYLGHPVDQCSPAQLVELRDIYGAIRDGEATWRQVVAAKAEADGEQSGAGPGEPPAPPRKSKGSAGAAPAPAPAPEPAPPAPPAGPATDAAPPAAASDAKHEPAAGTTEAGKQPSEPVQQSLMPAEDPAPTEAPAAAPATVTDSKPAAAATSGAPFMATSGEKHMLQVRYRNRKQSLDEALAAIGATMDTLTKEQFKALRNSVEGVQC